MTLALRSRAHRRAAWCSRSALALVVSALLAAASVGTLAAERAMRIDSIEVSGTRSSEPATVRGALAFHRGDALSAEAIDRSVRALMATGLYADVHIAAAEHGRVVVAVEENPRISGITFHGNTTLDQTKLAAAITLKAGALYTPARAHADALKIRDRYRAEGRYRTTVTPRTEPGRDGAVALVFLVTEGEVNKVEHIGFSGNRAYGDAELRDVITTTQSGWLDFLKSNLGLDRERLAVDRQLLIKHYRRHGFAEAKVSEARIDEKPSGGFDISFAIDEGERFTFGAQRVETTIAGIDTGALERRIAAEAGRAYDIGKIEASTAALGKALIDGGHPFVRVTPREARDVKAGRIAVAYVLHEAPHVYIRRIEIGGNTITRDYVVRRELSFAEGDAFNPLMIETARKQLMRTGLFKKVDIEAKRTPEPDKIDLRVAIAEQDSHDISFGIGYSQNDGIIGDASYTDSNLFGTGRTFKTKVELGQSRYGGEISVSDPHFLDMNVIAGFDLFYRDTDMTLQSSYKDTRWGGTLRLAAPITDEITTGVSYSFVRSTIYDVGTAASLAIREAVPGYPNATASTYDTSLVGLFTTYDSRDEKKHPTSGLFASARQEIAGLGGDAEFLRTTADVRAYYPVTDKITLAGHIGAGTISGYGGQDVRLLDMFYKGGETVRGFASSGLGPRDGLSANQDALGGSTYYVTSAEARVALPYVPESLGLSGLAFADAGSLFGANATAQKLTGLTGNGAAPRVSTGLGLSWDSPVGPLQATYAFVLAQQPGDKTQPLGFGFGSSGF